MSRCGRAALVGAGPGDPELLTLKAARILSEADVVLHDDLVPASILAMARRGARVVAVGKRGGCQSTPQAFIEHLMIREAFAGNFVVRLKGGDPFVFGRGGEELAALRQAGIEVEIVPGITSGLAAPASVGIPVTHRACAHGVALVTGHAADESAPRDWRALVASRLTLVIYMGARRVAELCGDLIAAGMPDSTPVAVIANATRAGQVTEVTVLSALGECTIGSPAIIVVGDVAALAESAQPVAVKAAGADVQI